MHRAIVTAPRVPRPAVTYTLTPALVAAHASGPVVCLASQAVGQTFRAHVGRPDRVPSSLRYLAARDLIRATNDVIGADGTPVEVADPEGAPLLAKVEARGPIMSRCGFVAGEGLCGGAWVDGYEGEGGLVQRMKDALADADVLLILDGPGGAACGLPEAVDAILEAKAQHGRRVYVVIQGWAASAHYWLASTLADDGELYITSSSQAGNIGARSAHCDQSGALAMQGLAVTDFAYPPGKIAQSPNRAPTEAGIARADRDVMMSFEAFAAAVGTRRPALTRKAIVDLDGDLLTGKAAVRKGLADAVSRGVEDVEAWAIAQAMSGPKETTMAETAEPAPVSKPGGAAEKDTPEKMGCSKCGEEKPGEESRYCAKCGTKFPEKDPDEEPDSTGNSAALAAQGVGGGAVGARFASMSAPQARASALSFHRMLDAIAVKVGARSHAEILGSLDAVVADAQKASRYRTERNKERDRNDARERLDLLASLYTQDPAGHPRGKLVVDILDDKTGKVTGQVKPAAQWSDGPEGRTLANLRAYTRTTLAGLGATTTERSPFAPPVEANADAAADRAGASQIGPAVKNNPAVRKAAAAGVKEDEAAALYAREFGGAR